MGECHWGVPAWYHLGLSLPLITAYPVALLTSLLIAEEAEFQVGTSGRGRRRLVINEDMLLAGGSFLVLLPLLDQVDVHVLGLIV